MRLTEKQKRIATWGGYPLLALVTFLFALHWTFPYERVKDRMFVEPLSEKFEVTVMDVERTFLPGGMILESVSMRTRPSKPDDEVTTLFFDEVRIDLGLLALIGGTADVDLTAAIGGGSIEGNLQASGSEIQASFTTSGLPLDNIPGVRTAVGLPMKGGLHADIDVSLPEGRWDKANGTVSLSCPGCTIGDGEAKIKPRARPGRRLRRSVAVFAGEGMTVPELNLGDVSATVKIEDGRGIIEDFSAQSPDGELALQAKIRFARQFKDSRFESGCMKFRLSEALKKREPNFGNLPQFMRMTPQSDGFSNVKLKGRLVTMRWVPTRSCEVGDDGGDERVSRSRPSRPTIPNRRPEPPKKPRPEIPPDDVSGDRVSGDRDGDRGGDRGPVRERPADADRPDRKSLADMAKEDDVKLPEPRTSGPPLGGERRREDDVRPPPREPGEGREDDVEFERPEEEARDRDDDLYRDEELEDEEMMEEEGEYEDEPLHDDHYVR